MLRHWFTDATPYGGKAALSARSAHPIFSLFLELNTQRNRAIGVARALLIEFPCTPDTHHGQLDAVSGHQTLGTDPDCGLGNPGSARDTMAGSEQVAIEREVVQDQL